MAAFAMDEINEIIHTHSLSHEKKNNNNNIGMMYRNDLTPSRHHFLLSTIPIHMRASVCMKDFVISTRKL